MFSSYMAYTLVAKQTGINIQPPQIESCRTKKILQACPEHSNKQSDVSMSLGISGQMCFFATLSFLSRII